ncbi:MAG: hypothetical protein IJO11_03760, partial [Alphaproteobacteria bacterium]|nr:hypothetical protein [Alphaproteobacteria bacterium]
TNASWDSTNKKCVCSSGSWSASSKKCVTTGSTQDTCYAPKVWSGGSCKTCYQVNNAKPNWNGSACAACPSGKPYWDGTQCVATCPASKPTYNANKVCVTCTSLDSAKPYWNGSKCVACLDNTHCKDNYYCNTSSTYACEELNCDKMGFETRSFYCSYVDWDSNAGFTPWMNVNRQYYTGSGDYTLVSGCRNSILVVPKDFQGLLPMYNCRVGTVTIDGVAYNLNADYTLNLKKGIHKITFETWRNKGKEWCTIDFYKTPGWDICMHYNASCPAGYYCEPDKLDPIICPTGRYCPAGDNYFGPKKCSAGTYNNLKQQDAQADCKNCPVHNYCPEGSSNPTACSSGMYYPLTNATQSSQCLSCNTTTITYNSIQNACHFCDSRYWRSSDGACLYCGDTNYYNGITSAECIRCTNRYWRSDNYCFNCNTVEAHNNVTQAQCFRCSNRFWRSSGSYCVHCNRTDTWDTTKQTECERCTNRYWVLYDSTNKYGYCYKCPDGMTRDSATGICKCPSGQIFSRNENKCVACTQSGELLSTQKSNDASCGGKRYYATNQYSYLCTRTDQVPATSQTECFSCTSAKRLWRSADKGCIACNDTRHHNSITQ